MKKEKFPISNILIFILVVFLFIGLFYMSSFFREKEESVRAENPIVFCQPTNTSPEEQQCFFTTHIHYNLEIEIFGESKSLGFESGPLQSFHTHSEKNNLHWHSLLSADAETKKPTELPTLQNLFDSMKIPVSEKGIYEYKVGMENPVTGRPAILKIFVDGEKVNNPKDYKFSLRKEQTIKVVFE